MSLVEMHRRLEEMRALVAEAQTRVDEVEAQISEAVGPSLISSGKIASMIWTFDLDSLSFSPADLHDAVEFSKDVAELSGPCAIIALADGLALELGEAEGEVRIVWGGAQLEQAGPELSSFIWKTRLHVDVSSAAGEADAALHRARLQSLIVQQVATAALCVATDSMTTSCSNGE